MSTTDTGVIRAGTVVDSQLFAVQSLTAMSLTSSATFDGAVLGVIYLDGSSNWAPSVIFLARCTTYLEDPKACPQCGFEAGDTATVSGTVNFNTTFSGSRFLPV